jgi:DNA-binding CsgD family transcriptional regulator
VLLVEDVDRIGPRALELLEWTAPHASLRIVTFTPDEADAEFEAIVARLHVGGAYELILSPLDQDAMRKVVAGIRIGKRRMSRASATRVVDLAGGNPSLANEIARTLGESTEECEETPIPPALRAQARAMLERLNEESQRIVMVASLLDRTLDVEFVAGLVERSESQVVDAFQQATLAGLTCELTRGCFVFNHPLLREAVRAETTATWSSEFHRRIASSLATVEDPHAVEESARHFDSAGDAPQAIERSTTAARLFFEQGEYADAVRNYRRVVRLVATSDATKVDALFALAGAMRRGGFEDEALNVYEELLRDERFNLDAAAKALVLSEVMHLSYANGDIERVNLLGSEILAMDLPATSLIKSETLVRMAGFACGNGSFDRALELLERIPPSPEPDDRIRARMHQQRGFAYIGLHDFEVALPEFRRGLELATASGDRALCVQVAANFGHQALVHARTDLALELLQSAFVSAQNANSESMMQFAIGNYATALMRTGRLNDAYELVEGVDVRGSDMGNVHGYMVALPMLELGSMTERSSLVARALEIPIVEFALRSRESQRIAPVAAVFAMHYWCTGEPDRARALLHDALTHVQTVRWNPWFCVAIAKCGEAHDVPLARTMLLHDIGSETALAAYIDLFDAFAARRRGRNAQAVRHGERAAAQFAALGWPFLEAQSLEVAGRHEAALQIYDAIGDVRDAKILRASIRPSRRGAAGHAIALTRREREVITLAAQGLTSKDIAERLAMGVRTVEHHLQVVYGKLGIRSRWQIPLDIAQTP